MEMLKLFDKLEVEEQQIIENEIAALLHCHKREAPWDVLENLRDGAKDINYQTDNFNQNVMVALIESGYL